MTKDAFERVGAKYEVVSLTRDITDRFLELRAGQKANPTQYAHTPPRQSHGEESFAIMCNDDPAILFKFNQRDARLTLLVIESLPQNPLKGYAFDVVLTEIERIAKERQGIDLIVIDRPVRLDHVRETIEEHGYITQKPYASGPRKTLSPV